MPVDPRLFGRSVGRIEDRALVVGGGRYLDDLQPENCLAAAFVRSPYAHASFSTIDLAAARAMPGVVAAFAADDLKQRLLSNHLSTGLPSPSFHLQADRPVLADGEVVYVGEPVAVVIAASRPLAEDAVDAVTIDFKPLAAVVDCRDALSPDAPRAHLRLPHNCIAEFGFAYGDTDSAFAAARYKVKGRYAVHRGGSHSMEGRGVLAVPDRLSGKLHVWSSTQTPQALKQMLRDLLDLDDEEIAVSTPDIGGGFGPKLVTYPEEIAVATSVLLLKRPVKWVEDRREHFLSTTQERDQHWDAELALDAGGKILGVRGRLVHDHGAYNVRGLNVPYGSGVNLPLAYNVPAYRLDIAVALTNKVPVTPIRGAGQPQANFVMERLLDRAAAATGLGRDEIRLRNLVRTDQMPCSKPLKLRGGTNVILDSGDYPATQTRAMAHVDWAGFPARRAEARRAGRRIGLGLANYVEGTGRGPYETAGVRIGRSGKIVVTTGATAMGQGTATMIAQIVGEQLGGDISNITVRTGSTEGTLGFGGFNSRQTVMAGASAHASALAVRRKLLKVASHLMEADERDLDVVGRDVVVKGVPELKRSLAELARVTAGLPGFQLPGIDSPGLEASELVIINDMTYSNGSALAEVEVDEETGRISVLRFTIAHDCGRMVNPVMVDGQVIGGIAHGLGNALFEQMIYDDTAQPLTTTFADYLLVSAGEMPPVDVLHLESPSTLNALGVKGVGESGVIPVAGAIMSAIDDALSDLDIHIDFAPVSPQALCERIKQARGMRDHARD
ncbi:MAG TPA: xanthine dehydrogenase family protein molybdopterin-binding subunit [Candidatus Binataceae bacterium]|nr:xanthine dehydrogenase family protein molybdopterin-binding subunit [Candidatus Binataceae bacterium]